MPTKMLPRSVYYTQFGVVAALWLVLLGLGAATLRATKPWRRVPRRDLVLLGLVVAVAIALRVYATPFPADIRSGVGQGFRLDGHGWRWAAAYSALEHALFLVFPPTLETVAAANAVIGVLSVVAAFVFGTVLLGNRAAALAGAAVLAVAPLPVRYSVSDSAHGLMALAMLVALTFAVLWAREGAGRWWVQAVGWLVLAMNVRLDAVVLWPAALALVAGTATWKDLRLPDRRTLWWTAGLLALALFPLKEAWDFGSQWGGPGNVMPSGFYRNPWFTSGATPKAFAVLTAAGALAVVAARETRRRGLALLGAVFLVSLPGLYAANDGWAANYRYSLPRIALFCVLAGWGLWAIADRLAALLPARAAGARGPAVLAAVLVVPLAVSLSDLSFLRRQWTHQLEYFFVRDALALVPDGCHVVVRQQMVNDAGLELSEAESRQSGRRHRWGFAGRDLALGLPGECTVFVQSSACFSAPKRAPGERWEGPFDELEECRSVRERFQLEPLAETTVPALPYANELFSRPRIPLGLYRLCGPLAPPRDEDPHDYDTPMGRPFDNPAKRQPHAPGSGPSAGSEQPPAR